MMLRRPLEPFSRASALAVFAAVLLAASLSFAGEGFPRGTYDNEGYTLTFDASGHFHYLLGSRLLLDGEYRAKGNDISLTDQRGVDACKGKGQQTGHYRWAFDGQYLSFAKVQDSCNERIRGVAGRWRLQPAQK